MLRQLIGNDVTVAGPRLVSARDAESILRTLPEWFGIEAALTAYAREAEMLPNFVALAGDELLGFATLREHNSATLELRCIAVSPNRHRCGLGSALCDATEAWWAQRGGKLLQVKTLGPSHADPNYARTRAFYDARGFIPVEEFADLWPGIPCLLMVKRMDGGREESTFNRAIR